MAHWFSKLDRLAHTRVITADNDHTVKSVVEFMYNVILHNE